MIVGETITQKALAGGSAGGGVFTAIMSYFDIHAAGIGAMCTVCTLIVYLIITLVRLRGDYADLRKYKQNEIEYLRRKTAERNEQSNNDS